MSSGDVEELDLVITESERDPVVIVGGSRSKTDANDAGVSSFVFLLKLISDISSYINLRVIFLKSLFGELDRIFLHLLGHAVFIANICFTLRCFLPVYASIHILFQFLNY